MTDDANDTPEEGLPYWHPSFGTKEEFQEQWNRQQMEFSAAAHRAVEFFESLTEEQLMTFQHLLQVIRNNKHAANYYAGITSHALFSKFGICPACGKKHDEVLDSMAHSELREEELVPEAAESDDEEMTQKALVWQVHFINISPDRPLTQTQVECNHGCGAVFVNLGDRMLRRPGKDGCVGCNERAKFG